MAIATFHTWPTYGTWLPGDIRGWVERRLGYRDPDPVREEQAREELSESPVLLTPDQRLRVEAVVADHCRLRGWALHAVQCRSNHVHVVVSAGEVPLKRPRQQFKDWATRRLKPDEPGRKHWWADGGWDVYIDDEKHLQDVIRYVQEGQEWGKE